MRYFIIAGEASGDMHGAKLIRELKNIDGNAEFIGLGGYLMRDAGCRLIQDYRQMAYMGFVAVAMNFRKIRRNFSLTYKAILDFKPDHLILIDYPTFNLKIASFVKKHLPQTKISYYIPPKVWAWKTWRIHKIASVSDHILGIFPFEPDFYSKYGYRAEYVGNPTLDAVNDYLNSHSVSITKRQIAIVPGSRRYEVEKCLPVMLKGVQPFVNDYDIIVTMAPTLDEKLYRSIIKAMGLEQHISLTRDTYDSVVESSIAVVNSGTATLETALLNVPQVAVYHVEFPHIMAALRNILFSIKNFTLVNIIAGRSVIRELLATEFKSENIENELHHIINDETYRNNILNGYQDIRSILSSPHQAAVTASGIIYDATCEGTSINSL